MSSGGTQKPARRDRDEAETEQQPPGGSPTGPFQVGGTKVDEAGRVTYTEEGAVSATDKGPLDPTVIPGQFDEPAPGEPGDSEAKGREGERPQVVGRDDVPEK